MATETKARTAPARIAKLDPKVSHEGGTGDRRKRPNGLRRLVGSGDKIMVFTMPFLIVGGLLNWAYPEEFAVGGPSTALRVVSILILIPGVIFWIWSVILILAKVPHGQLITSGPFSLVRHPLYTDVALLVLPWVGFLLDTWLGALVGMGLYIGSRLYAPKEEEALAWRFGARWDAYVDSVKIPWL